MKTSPTLSLAAPWGQAVPCLRRAQACDGPAVGAFLGRLSDRSRYFRFHGTCSGQSPALRKLLCDVDGSLHQAWLAWTGTGPTAAVVGEARFVTSPEERVAELAIVVADEYQGSGLAQALMRELLGAAQAAGVAELYGEVMDSNARMQAFLRRHRFDVVRRQPGEVIRMSRHLTLAASSASFHADPCRRLAA
jgi:ribosomal protein S18 acetylase RimI-like enzyme